MSPLFILLNGPPGCGKTTIARELSWEMSIKQYAVKQRCTVKQESFAAPMKHFVEVLLGQSYNTINKEQPQPVFTVGGVGELSVREFMIGMAESHLRPNYGRGFFARCLMERVDKHTTYVIVDDLGFEEEWPVFDKFIIVKITRPGKTFTNDSRNYVGTEGYVLNNDGNFVQLLNQVRMLSEFIYDLNHKS